MQQIVYLLAPNSSMILLKAHKKYQIISNYSKTSNKYKISLWFIKNLIPEKLVLKTLNLEDFIYVYVYVYILYVYLTL